MATALGLWVFHCLLLIKAARARRALTDGKISHQLRTAIIVDPIINQEENKILIAETPYTDMYLDYHRPGACPRHAYL